MCAVDLAGAEALYSTADFAEEFSLAGALEVPLTIHAGEADGPKSVYDALAFGAKRIGHGVRSIEDADLVSTLAQKGIALELCPTSNLNTRIFDCLEAYPIRKLMKAGVKVTVNTDNMTVSGVCLESEYQKLIDAFCLTSSELETIVRNCVEASFADAAEKAWLFRELDRRFSNLSERSGQKTGKETVKR